jgi:hypothetical protein
VPSASESAAESKTKSVRIIGGKRHVVSSLPSNRGVELPVKGAAFLWMKAISRQDKVS